VPRIALQLYTIRAECARDLERTIAQVGELGYDGVELYDLHGHAARDVRHWLDRAGLAVAGRHARLEDVEGGLPELREELETLGADRLAVSWVDPAWIADPEATTDRIAAAARSAGDAGLRLGVHNHAAELAPLPGGGTFLDRLRSLPADLLWLELDLGWIWFAGADPAAELAATRGRCPLVHVKDYASRTDRDDVPVGEGVVGYDRVVPAALAAGAEWLIAEEDEVEGDPFDAVARSLAGLRRFAEPG
jgi:sugar phosphate isomerase/epimerase